jgi:hypothetical protein
MNEINGITAIVYHELTEDIKNLFRIVTVNFQEV